MQQGAELQDRVDSFVPPLLWIEGLWWSPTGQSP